MTRPEPAPDLLLPQLRSLPAHISEYLAEAILCGRFAPGQPIIEQEVADMFGVSRGPVREAFRILEKDGVVVINPRRSVYVTRLTLEEVAELFQIRGALFGLAARLCAERHSDIALGELDAACENIRRFPPSGEDSAEPYSEAAAETTRLIVSQCGNQRLTEMLNRVGRQIQRYSLLGLSSAERQHQSIDSFVRLITAIREGQPAEADATAKEMVNNTGAYAAHVLECQDGIKDTRRYVRSSATPRKSGA